MSSYIAMCLFVTGKVTVFCKLLTKLRDSPQRRLGGSGLKNNTECTVVEIRALKGHFKDSAIMPLDESGFVLGENIYKCKYIHICKLTGITFMILQSKFFSCMCNFARRANSGKQCM